MTTSINRRRILITGASGLIGAQVLAKLSDEGHEVLFTVSSEESGAIIKNKNGLKHITYISYKDSSQFLSAVREYNPQVVLHLAGYTSMSLEPSEIKKLIDANLSFGTLLLAALEGCDLEYFINVGSCMEYFSGPEKIAPANLYAATKSSFRVILDYFAELGGYKVVQANLYFVYGLRSERKKVLDYLLEGLVSSESVAMSPGEQKLDLIHLDDVTNFFLCLIASLSRESAQYSEYFVGTGKGHTIRDIAGIVEHLTSKKLNLEWGAIKYRARDMMLAIAPVHKNPSTFEWRAQVSLSEGLKKMIEQ